MAPGGDTLVVDVTAFQTTRVSIAGNYTATIGTRERATIISPYHLMYEATIGGSRRSLPSWKVRFRSM